MSFKSPLGRLPMKKSRGPYKSPPIQLPEKIRLPDGREFDLKELLAQIPRNKEYINLLSKKKSTRPNSSILNMPKYTIEERRWVSEASKEEIIGRYNCRPEYVKTLKDHSQRILDDLSTAKL